LTRGLYETGGLLRWARWVNASVLVVDEISDLDEQDTRPFGGCPESDVTGGQR
jgi:hypothetical protein